MTQRLVLVLTILLLIGSAEAQNIPSSEAVAKEVQHLMDVEVGFEKMVPPGVSIEVKEFSRQGKSNQDLLVKYHIYLKGVPPDALFQWIQWPINADKPTSALSGISVGKDGILVCAGRKEGQCGEPSNPDDPVDFIITPRKGEPSRIAFVNSDLKIGTVIVPDPVEAKDRGCTLSAVRLTSKFELAFVTGTGYPPNSEIHYQFKSDTTSDRVITSDQNGAIRVSLVPPHGKKSDGTATIKVTEPKCSPQISYEWGKI